MTAIGFVLVLMGILFFLGMGVVYLVLLWIGKLTAPKEERGEKRKGEDP